MVAARRFVPFDTLARPRDRDRLRECKVGRFAIKSCRTRARAVLTILCTCRTVLPRLTTMTR